MNHNVLVIGAGIGGISAALWLRDRHVAFDWVEAQSSIGGTLQRVGNPIDELAGLKSRNGPELIERYRTHLESLSLAPEFNRRVTRLEPSTNRCVIVHFGDGTKTRYDAVVISTGTQPRTLGLEHEETLLGRGVELSVTRTRHRYKGKPVAVVGGGDAALEGLLLLTDVTSELHIIHRRTSFNAQPRFIDAVMKHPRITKHLGRRVVEIIPTDDGGHVTGLTLDNGQRLNVGGLFVRIGVQPTYPEGLILAANNKGYLPEDVDGRGPLLGTYIVGDVGTRHYQSVAWAMGSAARAVLTLCHDLRT